MVATVKFNYTLHNTTAWNFLDIQLEDETKTDQQNHDYCVPGTKKKKVVSIQHEFSHRFGKVLVPSSHNEASSNTTTPERNPTLSITE